MTMEDQPVPQRSLPTSPAASQKSAAGRDQLWVNIMATPSNDDAGGQGMSGLLAERMAEGGGALCNDQNGECLGARGNINTSQSGAYTSIAKLAAQLDSTVDGSGNNSSQEVPLVSIQTESAALLVKEYGGS
eukprot:147949_1